MAGWTPDHEVYFTLRVYIASRKVSLMLIAESYNEK